MTAIQVVGVEIKASAAPRTEDGRDLTWLRDTLGDRFLAGVVLHTGPGVFARVLAVPNLHPLGLTAVPALLAEPAATFVR